MVLSLPAFTAMLRFNSGAPEPREGIGYNLVAVRPTVLSVLLLRAKL